MYESMLVSLAAFVAWTSKLCEPSPTLKVTPEAQLENPPPSTWQANVAPTSGEPNENGAEAEFVGLWG